MDLPYATVALARDVPHAGGCERFSIPSGIREHFEKTGGVYANYADRNELEEEVMIYRLKVAAIIVAMSVLNLVGFAVIEYNLGPLVTTACDAM